MASAALTELTRLLRNEALAEALYRAVTQEFTDHLAKHVAALKLDEPHRTSEAEVIEAVIQRVRTDPSLRIQDELLRG